MRSVINESYLPAAFARGIVDNRLNVIDPARQAVCVNANDYGYVVVFLEKRFDVGGVERQVITNVREYRHTAGISHRLRRRDEREAGKNGFSPFAESQRLQGEDERQRSRRCRGDFNAE